MPPVNDNLANATQISGDHGATGFTLVGATSETGEPGNNGSTVWFIWQNTLTTPYTGSAVRMGVNITFGTRWRPAQTGPTTIPTVITVWKASNIAQKPPFQFSDFVVGSSSTSNSWGWTKQGQVTVTAYVNDWLAIRIDTYPGGPQGGGTLWWELANEKMPFPCGCIPDGPNDSGDGNCLKAFAVSMTQPTIFNYPTVGNAPAGSYIMRYCGGAFTYDSQFANVEDPGYDGVLGPNSPAHWVVGKIPPNSTQTWTAPPQPPLVAGYFYSWQYAFSGVQFGNFTEGLPTSGTNVNSASPWGYWTPAMAENGIGCQQVMFQHDGTAPIKMVFTDLSFVDDFASSSGPPVFSLNQMVPNWVPLTACSTKVSAGVYDVQFTIQSNNRFNWPNVTAQCVSAGGVLSSNSVSGLTIYSKFGFPSTTTFTLRITLTSPSLRAVTATVQFSDFSGNLVQVSWNLAPYVVITSTQQSNGPCVGYPHNVFFSWSYYGIAADNLVMTFQVGGQVAGVVTNPGCAPFPNNQIVFGAVGCTGNPSQVFEFSATQTGVISLPLAWADAAVSYNLPTTVLSLTA